MYSYKSTSLHNLELEFCVRMSGVTDYDVNEESFIYNNNSTRIEIPVALVMVSAEKFIIDYGVCQGEVVVALMLFS